MNTSKRDQISELVDIELSRDEDSVTSLAVAHAEDDSIVAFAGINSSSVEQQRDNNQHLRSFRIDYPPLKSTAEEKKLSPPAGKTSPLSRTCLFRTRTDDAYQRILRLSPWKGPDSPRVGAIATGLAQSGEIVFFNAATSTPTESDVIGRINLGAGEEAEDVDIRDLDDNGDKFRVAYTNGVDVFTCEISPETRSHTSPEVRCVYTTTPPSGKARTRPKFRALRFISPTTLLLLQNVPDRSGCELLLLRLPESKNNNKEKTTPGTVVRRRKLHKTMKIGLGLDVCNLGGNPNKERQCIIAISGSDHSIAIFTVEYAPKKGYGKLQPYTILRDVHPFSMTRICFSPFTPPVYPVSGTVLPQKIKLASVSMGNTVVVHTFPLAPFPTVTRTPRYVLVRPGRSEAWDTVYSVFAALFIIVVACVFLQAFTEIRGGTPPYLGAADWLPPRIREMVARPYMFDNAVAVPSTATAQYIPSDPSSSVIPTIQVPQQQQQSLLDLLHARRAAGAVDPASDGNAAPPSIIVLYDRGAIDISLLPMSSASESPGASSENQNQNQNPRPWEELGAEGRSLWKQRLLDAGQWAVGESEAILEGVFFGELNGLIENAVRNGLP